MTVSTPDVPLLVVPEEKDSNPLTPAVPALSLRTIIEPEVVGVLNPELIEKAPPVLAE
jgi:hypothetical protein